MTDVAAWVGAIATAAAVVVALFGLPFERWRRRPRLVLLPDPPPELGRAAKVVGGRSDRNGRIFWLRLPVVNRGLSTAEDVRAVLLRIDAPVPLSRQPPSRELKWADVAADRATLPPRVARLVDVVHVAFVPEPGVRGLVGIRRVRKGIVSGVQPLSAADQGQPGTLLWRDLVAGRYVVHISLSAKDVPAIAYEVRFTFDADLEPDAVADSLRQATVVGS